MRSGTNLLRCLRNILLYAAMLGFAPFISAAQAASFKVVHAFTGGSDGGYPAFGSLIRDASGNLYGTMRALLPYGSVYELAPNGKVTILYSFFPGGKKGAGPDALLMDKEGDLLGTACCGGDNGCGVVFKITPKGHESLIHTFAGPPLDGCGTYAVLTGGGHGGYYGTTTVGGKYQNGVMFQIGRNARENVIHSFRGGRDGYYPYAGLTIDAHGNLYGTADKGGGKASAGVIFELSPKGVETLLYEFKGSPTDGAIPSAGVVLDASGNIFGTTLGGGRTGCFAGFGCGIIYKLAPDGTETVLHMFKGGMNDGANPVWAMIADNAGNLYGTTEYGGGRNACNGSTGCGTVFEFAPDGTETILHRFNEATDGANPVAGLVADGSGHYYGTTSQGGAHGYGTVFEITP